MIKTIISFTLGSIFSMVLITTIYPKIDKPLNTLETDSGSIRFDTYSDKTFPARIEIRIKQKLPNKNGVCNIETRESEWTMISLEHLSMLDHFAYRYLEKEENGYFGGCKLNVKGRELK